MIRRPPRSTLTDTRMPYRTLFRSGPRSRPGGVAGLSIEHAASLICLERLNAAILPVDGAGQALPPDKALIPESGLVATMLVNNEVGTIQPVGDFVAAAHAKASLPIRKSTRLNSSH